VSTATLEDFVSSKEAAARIGSWEAKDQFEIAILKLADSSKIFYQGCTELHAKDVTWDKFKTVFRQRFRDVHTDQYHYMRLQKQLGRIKTKAHRSLRIGVGP
jgi:hypothetical protein